MRTSRDNNTALKCAVYFILGGWLTFLATRTAETPHAIVSARETLESNIPRLSDAIGSFHEPGPAGRIEATEIPFSHPNGVFPDRGARLKPERWIFNDLSERQLTAL